MNSTPIPWRIFFYRIPLARKDERPHTAGLDDTAIPPIKIKITEIYRLKESSIPQYRQPPCPPRLEKSVSNSGTLVTWKQLYIILSLIERFHSRGPASMLIYWNKRKFLHKKRVQLPQDWLGTPTWPPFHCFGTPIWPPWRHVKTLYHQKIPGFNKGAIRTS